MADAKKCDLCSGLYEHNFSKVLLTRDSRGPFYEIEARLVFSQVGMGNPLDICNACTELAVKCFMQKFDIKERNGSDIVCHLRWTDHQGPEFHSYDPEVVNRDDKTVQSARQDNLELFRSFIGKRVRINLEEV